jgi:hypothetical protein
MKNLLKSTLTALLVMVVLALVVAIAPGRSPDVASVQASGLNNLISSNVYPPLLTGTTRYTTSQVTSPAVSIASYGDVQIMLKSVVTGSQTITVIPQFSLQDVSCASVTQWFTSTTYQSYQPYSIASNGTTITETVGAWQGTPVDEIFNVSGSNVGSREISTKGQCMRVLLKFSNAGQSYTPTLVIRAVNRN